MKPEDLFLQIAAGDRLDNLIKEVEQVIELRPPDRRKVNHTDDRCHYDYSRHCFHWSILTSVQLFTEEPRAHAHQRENLFRARFLLKGVV